jgi:hypothetical protein
MTVNTENAQKLSPDAEIILYELTTLSGSTIFFKPGPDVMYLGDPYKGVPCSLSNEVRSVEADRQRQTLTIGGDNADLGILKSVLFSGEVDGASILKHVVELEDLKNNVNSKMTSAYTVKQVEGYSRSKISLVLGRFSPSKQTTIPYRKYNRPAFPYVRLQ